MAVTQLYSSDATDHPPAFNDFTGLLFIKKLSAINALLPPLPPTLQYTFTRKRRKVYVEQISLGPEGSRSSAPASAGADLLCAPGPKSSALDF